MASGKHKVLSTEGDIYLAGDCHHNKKKHMSKLKKILQYLTDPDYRIFKNAKLGLYDRLSDEDFIKLLFKVEMGYVPDLENPRTINEKLQWIKIYDHNPLYTKMVDKIAVKDYVKEKIGGEHIIRTLGIWDSYDDIDFETLPEKFVLKCNHDSGGLVIVKDKEKMDRKMARKTISSSLRINYYKKYREWPYKDIKAQVFAEEYLDAGKDGLTDYKFFCFNGEPKFINVSRFEHTDEEEISFYSLDWKPTPFQRSDHKVLSIDPPRPAHLDEMISISRKLSEGIPFLRVDLYEFKDRILFGELTLFPTAGMAKYGPEGWSETLGSWIHLPMKS